MSLFLFAGKNISLHCLLPSLTHIKEVLRDRGFHCSKSNGPLMMVMMVMTWQESRAEVSVVPSRLGRPLLLVVCPEQDGCVYTNKAYHDSIYGDYVVG